MFFVLSKILFILIKPICWIIGLLIAAYLVKNQRRSKSIIAFTLTLSLLLTNKGLFNTVIRAWETRTASAEAISEPFDIGILLGGYSNLNLLTGDQRYNLNERGNRLLNTLDLYHAGKIKKILLSGGTGSLKQDNPKEAERLFRFLQQIGIPDSAIIVEAASRNTYENALFSKRIVETQFPGSSCLLITSAWHMPRSIRCFQKVGLTVTPFSVDFLSEKNQHPIDMWLIPDKMGFYKWEILIKEWIGMLAYRLKGYH
jgi:uncharacterized SAM-binding protein YcdF (DUF218 family)